MPQWNTLIGRSLIRIPLGRHYSNETLSEFRVKLKHIKLIVTTHVVRLKGFRLKAEVVQKAQLTYFGAKQSDSCAKHGFPVNGIFHKTRPVPVFPNPAYLWRTFSLTTLTQSFFPD